MTKTKIIFMGTPQFAATVLKGLIDSNQYEILAVVTQPDRKVGRKQELRMTPVKELALTVNLPVLQPEKLCRIWTIFAREIIRCRSFCGKYTRFLTTEISRWSADSLCHYEWRKRSWCDNHGNDS